MDTIYKVCVLGKGNEVREIIVFSNRNPEEEDNVFNAKEQSFIEEKKIPIRFSKMVFHKDDSIATIKNKILKELGFAISYHELYLFSNIKNPHKNIKAIFESVSGKDEFIDRNKFKQLIMNLGIPTDVLETLNISKKQFFLEDFIMIQESLTTELTDYKLSIGKHFRMMHDELFSANPYDILKKTKIVHKSSNHL